MKTLHKIEIIGHLGHPPEMRETKRNSTPYVLLNVAVNTRNDEATWYKCSVFNEKAMKEFMEKAGKGTPVFIEGTPNLHDNKIFVSASRALILQEPQQTEQNQTTFDDDVPF